MTDTKAVNLTEDEITQLICWYGYGLHDDTEAKIERINYLNKRLKAFKEPEFKQDAKTEETIQLPPGNLAKAWPTNG